MADQADEEERLALKPKFVVVDDSLSKGTSHGSGMAID
jgi:hypothetical protein